MSASSPAAWSSGPLPVSVVAEQVGHRYAPGRGLDPVSFAIAAPGVVAITGANGAGKSTLMRALAGLLRPSTGRCRIEWEGKPLGPVECRGIMGFASPELSFYEELTVAENLRFAAETRESGADNWRTSLERVGLDGRRDDRVQALSSGMKQRLRLAFALLGEPPLLLLDEPGSHLDESGRAVVRDLLDRQRERGLAVVATNDEREWSLAESRIELRGRRLGDHA